ncbi:MAG: FAD-dependent oxidoreductase [Pseudorhodoplanes sp.]|nr:FAD-dependent oxidoreductase [Pseudorhodoplanes sp.]GIK81520.1 MAG: oxidoreductase [Alphaproteobacteria bacterium]
MADRGVVIVGGGQGAFQLAASLRELGFAASVTIVGEEPVAPYQRPPLSKAYLLGEMDRERLLLRPLSFYDQHEIGLLSGESVTRIERTAQRVVLASGAALDYAHLVLATGARNRHLPGLPADATNVFHLRTLAESDAIREHLAAARDIAVVGAGFIGLELAAVASKLGKSVRVIDQMPRVMSRAVSQTTSEFFAGAHRAWGVALLLGDGVAGFDSAGGRVTQVRVASGAAVPADLLLVGIGVVPNVELAAEAGLPVDNGIVVDRHLLTADPAISAIGDCASFPSRFTGGMVRLESVQNAVDHARCVAARLTGKPAEYGSVPWFWSDQRDLKLQMVGMTAGSDRSVLRGDPATQRFSVYCFSKGTLAGIESVNRPADHMFGRRLLAANASVTPEQVADPAFDPKTFLAAAGVAAG